MLNPLSVLLFGLTVIAAVLAVPSVTHRSIASNKLRKNQE